MQQRQLLDNYRAKVNDEDENKRGLLKERISSCQLIRDHILANATGELQRALGKKKGVNSNRSDDCRLLSQGTYVLHYLFTIYR